MSVVARGQISVVLVDDGIGISSVDVYYYLSTSSTTQSGGNWSTTAPAWVDSKYMWSKTRVTYTDATYKESLPVCITGGKGSTGKGVASIITEYYLSTSKTTQTGGSWVATPPAYVTGKYMWTRTKITWSDATVTYTTPICDSRINDLEMSVETIVSKQASIDTSLADITLQASETIEKLYHYSAGAGNIYDGCAVAISKDASNKTEVSLSAMPLVINKDVLRGRDIVISVDIYAKNAIPKSLSGYMGAYFTVTYNDNTSKKYMCAYYPGVRYLQQQLAVGSTSMYQRIYTTATIDDKAIKSVSNLTIVIACNGEVLKVSNPKVEIGTEPINGELGTLERVRKAEMKITPEAITQAVSEQIGSDGVIKTAKFTLDKDGGHFSGGGIDIGNNAGDKVFYADTEGNLTLKKVNAIDGVFSGTVNAVNGTFTGEINSSVINGGKINGTTIETDQNVLVGGNINMLKNGSLLSSRYISMGPSSINSSYDSINGYGINITNRDPNNGRYAYMKLSSSNTPLFDLDNGGGSYIRGVGSTINIKGNIIAFDDLNAKTLFVTGSKHRVVYDSIEGHILMNAVESTYAVFEDYGTDTLDENGRCVIRLDKRFLATVNTFEQYFTFLTPLGEGNIYVKNKYNFAFVVAGTPGLEFDWRVTVKQKGYENVRMDKYKKEEHQ